MSECSSVGKIGSKTTLLKNKKTSSTKKKNAPAYGVRNHIHHPHTSAQIIHAPDVNWANTHFTSSMQAIVDVNAGTAQTNNTMTLWKTQMRKLKTKTTPF